MTGCATEGTAGLRVMRDPDLLESGLLAPGSCAAAEAAVLAAAGGPHGAIAASLGWEVDAVAVRCAIAFLEAADESVRAAVTGLDRRLALAEVTALAAAAAVGGQDALTEHPPRSPTWSTALGGPVGALALGLLYGDPGRPVVTPYPVAVPGQPRASRRRCATWSRTCTQVALLSDHPDSPANGTIEVQTITGPDGEVRHIVYLPGTDDFNDAVGPGRRRPRPGDRPRPGRRPARRLPAGHPSRRCTTPASGRTSRCCSSATPRAAWRRPRSGRATAAST